MSIAYYNENAESFHADTAGVDMSALYAEFLPLLPDGGHIIDAGCGSGRDALAFRAQGFQVTAFDASEALVAKARAQLGQDIVQHCTFLRFEAKTPADAIWACASLLHVAPSQLFQTFTHLAAQLKPNGIMYCSFKYGTDQTERDGRTFTNLNEALLAETLQNTGLSISKTWRTSDARPGREHEQWLNAILLKVEN